MSDIFTRIRNLVILDNVYIDKTFITYEGYLKQILKCFNLNNLDICFPISVRGRVFAYIRQTVSE